jgi:hypothetical protein
MLSHAQKTVLINNEFRTDAELAKSGHSFDMGAHMQDCY